MGLKFRPVENKFYGLFDQLADHLGRGAALLTELLAENVDTAELAERMHEAEHAADETTHEIVRRVNSTFVTPFDREDIYALVSAMDDVMDAMDEAVDLVHLYEVTDLAPGCADQVEVLQQCADLTVQAMPRLESMKGLEEYFVEVNRLENQGDRSFRRILAHLFGGEYGALEVLKHKDIATSLESAVDAFETVANAMEQITVKES